MTIVELLDQMTNGAKLAGPMRGLLQAGLRQMVSNDIAGYEVMWDGKMIDRVTVDILHDEQIIAITGSVPVVNE